MALGLLDNTTFYVLSVFDGEDLSEVEDGLFPVSIFAVWSGGKGYGLVASGEIDIEPCDQSMYEVRFPT